MLRRESERRVEASGQALLDHWRWAAGRGLMNAHTANGLRSACAKVLGVIEGWETLDVRALDVDEALARFQNAKKRGYLPTVLDTYKRRFRLAVASYVAYLQDPGGWTPGIPERTGRRERKQPRGSPDPASPPLRAAPFVEFPFPLREGRIARLVLPSDLKASEVRRLTAFLNTLVLDREAAPRKSEPG